MKYVRHTAFGVDPYQADNRSQNQGESDNPGEPSCSNTGNNWDSEYEKKANKGSCRVVRPNRKTGTVTKRQPDYSPRST